MLSSPAGDQIPGESNLLLIRLTNHQSITLHLGNDSNPIKASSDYFKRLCTYILVLSRQPKASKGKKSTVAPPSLYQGVPHILHHEVCHRREEQFQQLKGPFCPVFCHEAACSRQPERGKTKASVQPHPLRYLQLRDLVPAAVCIRAVNFYGAVLTGFVRSHLNPQVSLSHDTRQRGAVQSTEPPACTEPATL